MLRLAPCAFALLLSACASLSIDVEGLRCDEQNPCGAGYVCAAGHCKAACGKGACATPPSPSCIDAQVLRVHAETGTCEPVTGACTYPSSELLCKGGCASGACRGDLCAGVSCTNPPVAECVGPKTLRTYATLGACRREDGQCDYAPTEVPCANACAAGTCMGQDLCAGKVCDMPPPPQCIPGAVRSFGKTGTCESGMCRYAPMDVPCPGNCALGVCTATPLVLSQTGPGLRARVNAVDQVPGLAGNHVLVVGPGGFAARWDGTAWTTVATGTTQTLRAVWLASTTLGYVVGSNGTLLRYDGANLSPVPLQPSLPSGTELVAVHGLDASHVLVAAEAGMALRFDGVNWSQHAFPSGPTGYTYRITSALVTGAGDDRVVGSCTSSAGMMRGCVVYSPSLSKPFWVDMDNMTLEGFRSIGPSVTGPNFSLAGLTLSTRRYIPTPTFADAEAPQNLPGFGVLAISEGTPGSVFVLTAASAVTPNGGPGRLFRWVANKLEPGEPLLRLNGMTQAMSRAYAGGVILTDSQAASTTVFRRGLSTSEALDVGMDLRSVALRPQEGMVLMSPIGDLFLRRSTGGPSEYARPLLASAAFSQVAAGTSFALMAGSGGRLHRWSYNGSPLALTTGVAAALRGICRAGDAEFYAVGDAGTVLKTDGTGVVQMMAPTLADLRAVHCLGPGSAVAVGEGGTVLRLSAGSWAKVTPTFPDPVASLTAVSVNASGALHVAGGATVWRQSGASAWTATAVAPAPITALVARDEGDVYISADRAVLRYDGTGWSTAFNAPGVLSAVSRMEGRVAFAGAGGVVVEGK